MPALSIKSTVEALSARFFQLAKLNNGEYEPTKQSINNSINQPTNQPINQSINQSISQSIGQSVNHSISQSINRSMVICLMFQRYYNTAVYQLKVLWGTGAWLYLLLSQGIIPLFSVASWIELRMRVGVLNAALKSYEKSCSMHCSCTPSLLCLPQLL